MFKYLGLLLLSLASFAQITTLPPASGSGGGGAVSSVTAGPSGGMTCSPTTGSVICDVDTAYVPSKSEVQSGSFLYCGSSSGDTATCSMTPTLSVYTVGMCVVLDADTANTGAATLNIDGLGAKSILGPMGGALQAGDIRAGVQTPICYNGTTWSKVGPSFLVQNPDGNTTLSIKAGSGQSGSLVKLYDTGGTLVLNLGPNGEVETITGGSTYATQTTGNKYSVNSTGVFQFSSSSQAYDTKDTGIGRNAAGVVEINNGTLGTYADILARRVQANGVTVSALPAAASGNAGSIQYVTDANATTIGSTVAGGGSNKVLVWSNGSAWHIMAN